MADPGTFADKAAKPVYDLLHDEDAGRMCADIPEAACAHQPRNFVISALALSLTKTGDRLMDPKIVLAWMVTALGAPAAIIGLLSPVREALALLPQLFIARIIRQRPRRKFFWSLGSAGQAAALVLMAFCAGLLQGWPLGLGVLASLALFALSRGVSSVSYKDVLGKTVAKSRRGAVAGYAASIGGIAASALGVWLMVRQANGNDPGAAFFAGILLAAACLWLLAAALYLLLAEAPGSTTGGANAFDAVREQLALVWKAPDLRDFLIVRALLISTALATPFYVAIAQGQTGADLSGLGGFLLAGALASVAGGWVWGRAADASSRLVMAAAGLLAALVAALVLVVLLLDLPLSSSPAFFIGAVFLLALAHEGVRLGRSTYLVDLATEKTRASYTAVSNSVIGVLLMMMGAIAGAAFSFGAPYALAALGVCSLAASIMAVRLKPVSGTQER
ncbi:MAG: Permease of the major facilitator superfamily [Oceanicaulis sp. HLUCCA04]|nr:MAG: Permease of the major facilitator superfamily [Oceanicaulis sp. HLUCCA04]